MRRNALQLSRRHKLALYFSTLLVFASGVAWWFMDAFLTMKDEFGGATKHPLQPWMLKAHGAGAMLILIMIGTLLPIHVKRGWQAGQNLRSGISILTIFALL